MRALCNGLLVLVSILVSLSAIEIGLRLGSTKYARLHRSVSANLTTVDYRHLPGGLITLRPGGAFRFQTACTDIAPIDVNELGFRDRPWPQEKRGFRIVVTGDSFIEALHVADGEHVAAVLRRGTGAEVLNAGIGGYSTVTELVAYRRLIRRHRPDLVVLFLFPGNDVKGNSCRLDGGLRPCGEVEGDAVVYRAGEVPAGTERPAGGAAGELRFRAALKDFLRRRLVLYQASHDLRVIAQGVVNHALGRVPGKWRVYLDEPAQAWRDAWRITEHALATLKDEVAADGGRLALVAVPEHFTTNPAWRKELILGAGSGVPEGFDPSLPSRRLAAIAARLELPFLDLLPAFIAYRDANDLPYPYFGFACDGHWNPLAHFLAGRATAAFLADNGLMPVEPANAEALREARRAAFSRPPDAILGARAFRRIYGGGIYEGGAATR